MNYFQPYSLPADPAVLAAWDSQLAELAECPAIINALAKRRELFPRFAESYVRLRALPRGTRRALQRKLGRTRELLSIQPEWQRKLAGSLAGAALLLALAQSASAATITVTTNVPDINDGDGKCSLIEAIINANDDAATHPDCAAGDGEDTIVLPKKAKFNSFVATIKTPITIQGNDSTFVRTTLTVNASGDFNVDGISVLGGKLCFINAGVLTIENSKISGCAFASAGAVLNGGTATISNSVISGNKAYGNSEYSWTGTGGAAINSGTMTILNSEISDNAAYGNDFGSAIGGGIDNEAGTLIIQNSTIARNLAISHSHDAIGGGISNSGRSYLSIRNSTISGNEVSGGKSRGGGVNNWGYLHVENSTITGNSASTGGGVVSFSYGRPNLVYLRENVFADNEAIVGREISTDAVIQYDVLNLLGINGDSGVYGFTPGPTDIVPNVAVKKILAPLKNNGGSTLTHALVKGSPAIDAAPVDANCPATDQRGVARPQGGGCDIGAVEYTGKSSKKNKQ
jgi:hypothetical protein